MGFVNRMNIDLDLYFVNGKGEEKLIVSKLVHGAVFYEITYHMHRFRARVHGEVTGKIVKDLVIGDIEIPDCAPQRNNNNKMGEPEREPVKEMRRETYKDDGVLNERTVRKDQYAMDVLSWTLTMIKNSSSCYSLSL